MNPPKVLEKKESDRRSISLLNSRKLPLIPSWVTHERRADHRPPVLLHPTPFPSMPHKKIEHAWNARLWVPVVVFLVAALVVMVSRMARHRLISGISQQSSSYQWFRYYPYGSSFWIP